MAQRLNKKLVVALTVIGMGVLAVAIILMIATMAPEQDPALSAAMAEKRAAEGKYVDASRYYRLAANRARAGKLSTANGYLVQAGEMLLMAGQPGEALRVWNGVMQNDPDNAAAQQKIVELTLEQARDSQGEWWTRLAEEATELRRIAKKADPEKDSIVGLHALGLALVSKRPAEEENLKAGEQHLRSAFDSNRADPEFAESLTAYYFQRAIEHPELFLGRLADYKPDAATPEAQPHPECRAIAQAEEVWNMLREAIGRGGNADVQVAGWRNRGQFYMRLRESARQAIAYPQNRENQDKLRRLETLVELWDRTALTSLDNALALATTANQPAASNPAGGSPSSRPAMASSQPARRVGVVDVLDTLGLYWLTKPSIQTDPDKQKTETATNQQRAVEYFQGAMAADRESFQPYQHLATLDALRQAFAKAFDTLQERMTVGVLPTSKDSWRNRGAMLSLRLAAFEYKLNQADQIRQSAASQADYKKQMEPMVNQMNGLYKDFAAEIPKGEKDPTARLMLARIKILQPGHELEALPLLADAEMSMPQPSPQNAQAWLSMKMLMAQLYYKSGQFGAAETRLSDVLALQPALESALVLRADIRTKLPQREEGALQDARQALSVNPQNVEALRVVSTIAERQKNFDLMKEVQDKLIQITGNQGQVRDKLVQASILLTRAGATENPSPSLTQEAVKLLREVVAEDPTQFDALRALCGVLSRDPANAAEIRALIETTDKAVDQRLSKAGPSTQPGDTTAGLQMLKTRIASLAITLDPQTDQAAKTAQLEKLIRESGQEPLAIALNLYMLYSSDPARQAEAYKQLQEAHQLVKQGPEAPGRRDQRKQVVDMLFQAALRQKDWPTAESLITEATELQLDRTGGRYYKGIYLLSRTDQPNSAADALRELSDAAKAIPDDDDHQAWLGRAYVANDRMDDAIKAFTEALRLNPANVFANIGLAMLAERRGDEAEKRRYLAVCEQVAPNHAWVARQVQLLRDEQDAAAGNAGAAIKRREEIRKSQPDDAQNLYSLAKLYRLSNQLEQAKGLYQELLAKNPQDLTLAQEYADFLRTQSPPDNAGAEAFIQQTIERTKDALPPIRATAHLLLAAHHERMLHNVTASLPAGPLSKEELEKKLQEINQKNQEVDRLFVAAAEISDASWVANDIAAHFRRRGMLKETEQWLRKTVEASAREKAAADPKNRDAGDAAERTARKRLIDLMLSQRDAARAGDVLKEINEYKAKYPNDSFVLAALSDHASIIGRESRALAYMDQYVLAEPRDPWGFYTRANINYRRSNFPQASQDYRKAKELGPDSFDFRHRLLLAQCYEQTDQSDLALAELTSVLNDAGRVRSEAIGLALQGLVRIYLKNKQYDRAAEVVAPHYQRDQSGPQWAAMLAEIASEKRDFPRAIQMVLQADKASNHHIRVVDSVWAVYARAEQYDELVKYLTSLPEANRKDPLIQARLAVALAWVGKDAKATQAAYAQVAAGDAAEPNMAFINIVSNFARALEKLGRKAQPEKLHNEILSLLDGYLAGHPDDPGTLLAKSFVLMELGKTQEHLAVADQALAALKPEHPKHDALYPEALRIKALTLYRQKQYAEVRKLYEGIVAMRPEDPGAINNLAYLLMEELADPKSALPYSEKAHTLVPADPNVLDTLGWNEVLVGKYDSGIGRLRQALSMVPADRPPEELAPLHYHAAQALYLRANADKQGATEDLAEAKIECQEAHRLAALATADDAGLRPKINKLCPSLGLKLEPLPVQAGK